MRFVRVAGVARFLALVACESTDPDSYHYPSSAPDAGDCPADLTTPEGFAQALKCDAYKSCAFDCASGCEEATQPYQCPAMRPWIAMPHAAACAGYDGMERPVPQRGRCTATAPTGDALAPAGVDAKIAGRVRLPDGHFIQPAGREQVLAPKGTSSGFPLNVILVPGTRFAIVSDAGVLDNAIDVIDLDRLAAGAPAVVSSVAFPSPTQLYFGLAYVAPGRVFASGGADGYVYAFTLDATTGALARDPSGDLDMGPSTDASGGRWYVGGIAAGDASTLVVAPSTSESSLRVVATDTKAYASIDLGAHEIFDVVRDPYDAAMHTYWVTALDARALLRVDVATKAVTARIPTGKNPEGVALLGGTHVAVASSDDDAIAVYDAVSGMLVQTLALAGDGPSGLQPGVLEYDAPRKTLYATLSGINAVGAFAFDHTSSAPLTALGRIPAAWWPTAVRARDTGDLVVVTGKGHGTGPSPTPFGPGSGGTLELTRGSIALVPFPSAGDLGAMSAIVDASRKLGTSQGFPTVNCPSGAPYDFPVPLTNTGAPSALIQHVVYVVRENKTFDAIFGDFPAANGDPKLVMSPGKMDEFWKNARSLARAFAIADGYYVDAEQSLQGHIWNVFGRTTDYNERTWTSSWGRGTRKPKAGIDPNIGYPADGSLFTWLEKHGIAYDDMGEVVGTAKNGFDPHYPGFVYTLQLPDVDKACYIAARARATCDLKSLTYVVMPNDHTAGGAAGAPRPELMIAVNDEATGMLLDAISHSPIWATTLVVVTEDDPQNGGDHVDAHRTPLLLASPWVKRGYVTPTHIDVASLHKLFAHLFGKPYASETIANAAIPFDAFTSTPDYAPFTYAPRTTPTTCNAAGTLEARVAEGWDLRDPDEQPGLAEQVARRMREIAAP